jgi:hypothetical protein
MHYRTALLLIYVTSCTTNMVLIFRLSEGRQGPLRRDQTLLNTGAAQLLSVRGKMESLLIAGQNAWGKTFS